MNVHPFDKYIRRPESEWRLAEAALLFAADHDAGTDVAAALRRLDSLASRAGSRGASSGGERVETLRHLLADTEGFRGNREDYFAPDNSLLGRVLETRRGIPITLSVIWMDVAEQLGWPVVGLGLPGHFIVAYRDVEAGDEILVDPFDAGARFPREAAATHLAGHLGAAPLLTEANFHPSTRRDILTRMLNNLNLNYLQRQDWPRAARTILRLRALHPGDPLLERQSRAVSERLVSLN